MSILDTINELANARAKLREFDAMDPEYYAQRQDVAARLEEIEQRQSANRAYFPDTGQQSAALHAALDDVDWLLAEYRKLAQRYQNARCADGK